MIVNKSIHLIELIVDASKSKHYSEIDWEYLVRQARTTGMLSRLGFLLKDFDNVLIPDYVKIHISSAEKFWVSQKRILDWEVYNLKRAFKCLELPLILLKGTAYSAANLRAGEGRIFSDIDILVPEETLSDVSELLRINGWFPEPLDSYDKHYYTEWMHELPPFRHLKTGTTLDIHHNILPRTCKLFPDAKKLLENAIYFEESDFWTLCPEDMVLHSATHLFWGGEFDNGFRDLFDLDLLLREFSLGNDQFWSKFIDRSKKLGLEKPAFYALVFTQRMFDTPVPQHELDSLRGYVKQQRVLKFFFYFALLPYHHSCTSTWVAISRWCLFVRSHWLKMPWYMLFPHLFRKAWVRVTDKDSK
jgi:hypothetical protein